VAQGGDPQRADERPAADAHRGDDQGPREVVPRIKDLVETNPCVGLSKPSVESQRDRVLTEDEIRAFWVLLNGSALALDWADRHVPAIVEAWYPGEAGGTAVADVLFGKVSPAGRLPVTFHRPVEQLPPFDDYSMKGRTYRYFTGAPITPSGTE